jgi:hypothetical protein
MKALGKIKAALFTMCIALGVLIASTQETKAAYYDNYNTNYQVYINLYNSTKAVQFYYLAIGYYYYYLAGHQSDYYGYYSDPVYFKSTNYRGSNTYALYYYNLYAYQGDSWIRK